MSTSVSTTLAFLENERREEANRLHQLHKEVLSVVSSINSKEKRIRALTNFEEATSSLIPEQKIRERGKYEKISPEIKALVAKNVGESMTWKEGMETYQISRASISRIKKEKREGPPIINERPQKRGRKPVMSSPMLVHILDELDADTTLTLRELSDSIQKTFQITVSEDSVDHALKKMDVTWKIVLEIPEVWNKPNIIKQRQEYAVKIVQLINRNVFYINEAEFNMHVHRGKERAVAGEPATLSVLPKGKRISIIACLGNAGWIHIKQVNSEPTHPGVNAENYQTFLNTLATCVPRDSILVMDNVRIHHSDLLVNTWSMLNNTRYRSPFSSTILSIS